ncbi:rhodanese-like domain-containing protein [Halobacillus naozhouensis]|uniref:Rhodanese-like domain-containing protein n=1 Tax=Halobacillus naozhouensis TaxID=554880 RepID=A0ABY8IU02_9BACI|nr:rhodanese-like domain-containing protein [Halobacillus naozhouensis]WFT73545.1 rhodanese-like domain-containing protein [Halobacillus naozhouensis]
MELILILIIVIVLILFLKNAADHKSLTYIGDEQISIKEYCIIDIRDYISASHSPYPGSENIPLSYLSRELKERMDCEKNILLITDDKRGAKMAAKIIRKKWKSSIYYIKSA